ncbi:TPA_asm: small T antigen [Tilapia adomavirus 1]|nr:TPA_asm: small T antigen [Tilapia adomavirus 1]
MVLTSVSDSSSDEEEILHRIKQNKVKRRKDKLIRTLGKHGVNCTRETADLTLINDAITVLSRLENNDLKVKERQQIQQHLDRFRRTFDPSWNPFEEESQDVFVTPEPRPPSVTESEIEDCSIIDWDATEENPNKLPSNPFIQTECQEGEADTSDQEHEELPRKTPTPKKKKRKRPLFLPSSKKTPVKKSK